MVGTRSSGTISGSCHYRSSCNRYCGGGTGGISNTSHAGVWLFSPGGWFHKYSAG